MKREIQPWWPKHIAQRFADLRKQAGLSQADMGKVIGRKQSDVSKIETGRRALLAVELVALLSKTGRSLNDFWD